MTHASSAAPVPAASAAPVAPTPRGAVRLVIEHVDAVCIAGTGANGKQTFTVGEDVLVETVATEGAPPVRDFVYCSKAGDDGGASKPRLGIWRNCRRDPSCADVTEKGSERASVRCGRDTVTLEVVDGRTILRGSFGERVVAPYPMRIDPPKRVRRAAAVDC